MDEFGKEPYEFAKRKDEYTHYPYKEDDKRKDKRLKTRKRRLLKVFVSGTFVAMITPSLFTAGVQSDMSIIEDNASQITNDVLDVSDETLISDDKTGEATTGGNASDEEPFSYIECEECHGTGIHCEGDTDFGYDRGNGHGYAGCGGTGFSKCPDIWCNDGVKTCQSCEGSGIDHRGNQCVVCNGIGIVDCEFCHNTGIAECISKDSHVECARCSGTGKILIME